MELEPHNWCNTSRLASQGPTHDLPHDRLGTGASLEVVSYSQLACGDGEVGRDWEEEEEENWKEKGRKEVSHFLDKSKGCIGI